MPLSEGENKLIKYLDSLYIEGAGARAKASQNWEQGIEAIKGNVWPQRRPKYKINAVMNFLAQIIERKAAILTDSRPTITVVSRKQMDDPVADILQKVIEGILDEKNFEQKITEFVMLEQYFGFALFNTCYDKSLDYGNGDIDLVVIDPRCFIFDPFVTRSWNLQYGEYCCLETVKPTELLREQYRSRRDDIKADLTTTEIKSDSLIHKVRDLFQLNQDKPKERSSVIPRSIVRDWWIRDRTTRRGDALAYPNWRHIIIAGGVPVEDGANPYADGNHPFDGMEWGFNVDSPYGFNEINNLENPQIMFNKLLATVLENAILLGNGIWVGEENALSKEGWDRLTNEPGSKVKIRKGTMLRREPAPPLPNYMIETLNLLVMGLEKLSGITEVTEGRRPGQITSGVAIEQLALMAQTTIRLKARQLEGLLQRIGQKLISRIFSYYTTDRVFTLVGEGGIKQYHYERAKLKEALRERGSNVFQDYQFRVVPASSLAMTKWQKGLIATQLYQLGLIDQEAALDALEFPNREQILARMTQNPALGGEKRMPAKIPANLLRGGNRQMALQEPRMG